MMNSSDIICNLVDDLPMFCAYKENISMLILDNAK